MPRHLHSYFVATAAAFLLLACQGETTVPNQSPDPGGTLSSGQTPSATPGDTAYTAPATPAPSPSGDTARTAPPPPPAPSSIQLTVYVGVATPGPDTLRSTPVTNAHVAVFSLTYTRSTGPDTLTVTETRVATGNTDALGKVTFNSLPAANYRLEAVVDGRAAPASIQIAPPYPSSFATWIIFRP